MYKDENVKKEYIKRRYKEQKDRYNINQYNYWANYARKKLNKQDVTEEEIKSCKNQYYKEYRDSHKEQIKKTNERFWKNKAEELGNEN